MKLKGLSIRAKLVLSFLAVGGIPLFTSMTISYYQDLAEVEKQATERIYHIGESKAEYIRDYFENELNFLVDLASTPTAQTAMVEFAKPFASNFADSERGKELLQTYRQDVFQFYREQFAKNYEEKTKQQVKLDSILDKLDPLALAAQFDFIVKNENPVGKKDELVVSHRQSPYATTHVQYHAFFRDIIKRHGIYDLFLITPEGRVAYTVFKEVDFATSLTIGPWAKTGLGQAFENLKKLKLGESHLEDMAPYAPSYEAPALFSGTPIYNGGKLVGYMMFQMPIDRISTVVGGRLGLGDKGEFVLLGSDLKLRADTFRNAKTHNVTTSFAADSNLNFRTEIVKLALEGKSGVARETSYDGMESIAHYQPVKIHNLTWYLITELSEAEVFAGVYKLQWILGAVLIIGLSLVGGFAFFFGNSISNQLRRVANTLNQSSNEVSSASSSSASSATELSEAATEQAASLQQTMASIEEISAMVSQNAESALKTQKTVEANKQASVDGSQNVNEMLQAIGEIKNTNDDILTQMESSNKEFNEIVRIISEIGQKTTVINEIVFQTKLLSFNASVEAARAGEHGKGFAVVAEEVGNLAQMSGNAAKEITDMLSDSIKRVNSIVETTKSKVDHLVEVGKDKVSMGQATAQKCRDALDLITQNAQSIATMIAEITHASKEQAQGIQEINKAISQLDQVTQQNSAVAQQSSTQAEKLNSEAASLSLSVKELNQFIEGSQGERAVSHSNVKPSNESTHGLKPKAAPQVAKVIHLKSNKSGPANPTATASSHAPAQKMNAKKVAGLDVPSSSNPEFEEF